jgi:hypothetical protein
MMKTESVTCKLRAISVFSPVNTYNLRDVREAVFLWASLVLKQVAVCQRSFDE